MRSIAYVRQLTVKRFRYAVYTITAPSVGLALSHMGSAGGTNDGPDPD